MWLNIRELKRDVQFHPTIRAWGATVWGETDFGIQVHRNFYSSRREAEGATISDELVVDRWRLC